VADRILTDEELVRFVAKNESWALAEIYDRYARLVFSLALKILNDRSGAEEIAQEVFAKVWRGSGDFDARRGKFSSWLIGITHHQCIDELRRRRVRPTTESADHITLVETSSANDPVEAAAQSLERARVKQALEQIPREQRVVIEMAFFQGLTHQEIADRLNEPLGTIKTRVRLGMQKLKTLLQE
jgi:RNA polymerase sigma-70 factor (ECF subfamily)